MEFFEALRSNGEYAYFFNCSVDKTELFLKVGLAVFAHAIKSSFTLYNLNGDKVCKIKPPEDLPLNGCTMADSLDQVIFELEEVYI